VQPRFVKRDKLLRTFDPPSPSFGGTGNPPIGGQAPEIGYHRLVRSGGLYLFDEASGALALIQKRQE